MGLTRPLWPPRPCRRTEMNGRRCGASKVNLLCFNMRCCLFVDLGRPLGLSRFHLGWECTGCWRYGLGLWVYELGVGVVTLGLYKITKKGVKPIKHHTLIVAMCVYCNEVNCTVADHNVHAIRPSRSKDFSGGASCFPDVKVSHSTPCPPQGLRGCSPFVRC